MQVSTESTFLAQFSNFLSEHVAPLASRMDRDPETLNRIFEAFKAQSGLGIRIPSQEGGTFLSDRGFADYRIELARHCGALSFLQAQHQVAVTWLSKSPEPDKVRPLYQQILKAGVALGIGFLSPRHTSFEVKKEGRCYTLSGDIPWVTGHQFLQHVVTSFQHDGHRHFTILPFCDCSRDASRLSYSEPLHLIVFNALNTVRATLDNWQVHEDDIFLSLPVDTDAAPERHNSVYTLAGASKGLQDLVCHVPDLSGGMQAEAQHLSQRLDRYIENMMTETASPAALRAEGAQLAQDWSALARWLYGGKALLLDHPVNRLSREVWQYCIAGLKPGDLDAIYPVVLESPFED